MIDCEAMVFTPIAAAVRTAHPGCYVSGEYVAKPPAFPYISIEETSNTVTRETQSSSVMEHDADVTYEVNVYSNREKGKKAEAKAIIALIDGMLLEMGFTRSYLGAVPNINDATVYRMTGRYRAIVSKDFVIYRR